MKVQERATRRVHGATLALTLAVALAGAPAGAAETRSTVYAWGGLAGADGTFHVGAMKDAGWSKLAPDAANGCVTLSRRVTTGHGRKRTTSTVTERGCGALRVFLPATRPGTVEGRVTTDEGTTLTLEELELRLGHPTPFADVGEPTLPSCHPLMPQYCFIDGWTPLVGEKSLGIRRTGAASGAVTSSASGRHALDDAQAESREIWWEG